MKRSVTWSSALKVWFLAIGAYFAIVIASLVVLSLIGVIGAGVLGSFLESPKTMALINELTIERAGTFGHYAGSLFLVLGSIVAIKFALGVSHLEYGGTKNIE